LLVRIGNNGHVRAVDLLHVQPGRDGQHLFDPGPVVPGFGSMGSQAGGEPALNAIQAGEGKGDMGWLM
jgi:hypothetical protein